MIKLIYGVLYKYLNSKLIYKYLNRDILFLLTKFNLIEWKKRIHPEFFIIEFDKYYTTIKGVEIFLVDKSVIVFPFDAKFEIKYTDKERELSYSNRFLIKKGKEKRKMNKIKKTLLILNEKTNLRNYIRTFSFGYMDKNSQRLHKLMSLNKEIDII